MKKKAQLPTRTRDAWQGGFALRSASHVVSVSAAGGAAFAGREMIHSLAPGATRFGRSPTPGNIGDVAAVAVDPRRRGRMAAIGLFSVAIFEGSRVHVLDFPEQGFELGELAWSGSAAPGKGALS